MKNLFYLLIILMFVAACGTAEPEAPSANGENSSSVGNELATEEVSQPEETARPLEGAGPVVPAETDEDEVVEEVEEISEEAEDSPQPPSAAVNPDFTPATTPADAAIIRSHDWIEGATEPTVTIIEYGDFQ